MHDAKFDWSSLDPSRDTEHWNHLIESIADRAAERHRRRLTVSYQLLVWARPVLAAAAVVTLLFGLRFGLSREGRSTVAMDHYRRAYTLAEWADNQDHPTPSNVLQVLGDPNVNE